MESAFGVKPAFVALSTPNRHSGDLNQFQSQFHVSEVLDLATVVLNVAP